MVSIDGYSNAGDLDALLHGSRQAPGDRYRGGMAKVGSCMLFAFVAWFGVLFPLRFSLPEVTNPASKADFSGERVWSTLSNISASTRPLNSPANTVVRASFLEQLLEFKVEAAKTMPQVKVDVELGSGFYVDHGHAAGGSRDRSVHTAVDSSNLLLRFHGTESDDAVLITAHMDSVFGAPGATDDGIGVAVMLEIARNIAYEGRAFRNTLIFNFNNGEELGLYGARTFTTHPWFHSVKAFVNLEGAGGGGRELLFESSSGKLAAIFARAAPRPHASVMGNDIFRLGLIDSITDYYVYSHDHDLPGLDFAYYRNRYYYHSPQDSIHRTSKGSVQHGGNNYRALLYALGDEKDLFSDLDPNVASVYYDILGLFAFAYPMWAHITMCAALLALCSVAMVLSVLRSDDRMRLSLSKMVSPAFRALLALGLGFVLSLVFTVGAAAIVQVSNPSAIYGFPFLALGIAFPAALLGNLLGQSVIMPASNTGVGEHRKAEWNAQVGLLLSWQLALVLAIAAGLAGFGLTYYLFWWALFHAVGMVLRLWLDSQRRSRLYDPGADEDLSADCPCSPFGCLNNAWAVQLLVAAGIPGLITMDVLVTAVYALGPTGQDGTPALAVCLIAALFAHTITSAFAPAAHVGGRVLVPSLVFAVALVAATTTACLVHPFSHAHPQRLYYAQTWTADAVPPVPPLVTVGSMASHVDPALEAADHAGGAIPTVRTCTKGAPDDALFKFRRSCTYHIKPLPPAGLVRFNFTVASHDAHAHHRTVHAILTAPSSSICELHAEGAAVTAQLSFGNATCKSDAGCSRLRTIRPYLGLPTPFTVDIPTPAGSANATTVRVTCNYDVPATVPSVEAYLHDLPEWAEWVGTGTGMLRVTRRYSV